MILTGETRIPVREFALLSLLPPQIPQGLAQYRTRVSSITGRLLSEPQYDLNSLPFVHIPNIHIQIHTYTYTYKHTHTHMHIHIHIHTYIYTYAYTHIHIHTYTYTYKLERAAVYLQ